MATSYEQISESVKVSVHNAISQVLVDHYNTHIFDGSPDGAVAWEIMQDVRIRLGLEWGHNTLGYPALVEV